MAPPPAGPAAADEAPTSQDVTFGSAAGTLAAWIRVIGEARDTIRVACFTFDSEAFVAALLQARGRDVPVKLIFSGRDRHLTRNQEPRLQQLRASGCQVRAYNRVRCHAKVVLTDSYVVVGSCNLTEASQGNVERSVVVQLSSDDRELNEHWYDSLFDTASPFDGGQGRVPVTPPRATT